MSNYLSEPALANFAKNIKIQGLAQFNSTESTCEDRFPRIIGKTTAETVILCPCADLIKGGVAKSLEIEHVKPICDRPCLNTLQCIPKLAIYKIYRPLRNCVSGNWHRSVQSKQRLSPSFMDLPHIPCRSYVVTGDRVG